MDENELDLTADDSESEDFDIDTSIAEKWQEIQARESGDEVEEKPVEVDEVEENPVEALKPPSSWKKEHQATFSTLTPEIQNEILRRENDMHKGLSEYKQKADWARGFEPIAESIIGLRADYGNEYKGIEQLYKLSKWAEKDPVAFIQHVADANGIKLDGSMAAHNNPAINNLFEEVNQLKQVIGAQQEKETNFLNSEAATAIEKFKEGAEHFEDLRQDMAQLLEAGLAKDLEDAYDKALWQRKDLRQSAISKQVIAEKQEATKKAGEARNKASTNINKRGHSEKQVSGANTIDSILKENYSRIYGN